MISPCLCDSVRKNDRTRRPAGGLPHFRGHVGLVEDSQQASLRGRSPQTERRDDAAGFHAPVERHRQLEAAASPPLALSRVFAVDATRLMLLPSEQILGRSRESVRRPSADGISSGGCGSCGQPKIDAFGRTAALRAWNGLSAHRSPSGRTINWWSMATSRSLKLVTLGPMTMVPLGVHSQIQSPVALATVIVRKTGSVAITVITH